jgi:NADH-quinone oxidoreductase subunit N
MNLQELVNSLLVDTMTSGRLFRPELALCGTILVILLARCVTRRIDSFYIALGGALLALWWSLPQHAFAGWQGPATTVWRETAFTGMLAFDGFALYVRAAILLFLTLFVLLTRLSGVPDRDAAPDVYSLIFGATLGMCLMVTANHLLIIFLGVEMASVPSYALAGVFKGRRQSSEAALKFAVYGAGAAAILLYGVSLLAGLLGSASLPTMAARLADLIGSDGYSAGVRTTLALATIMLLVGLAFKLSAVPFHFWAPDVFEGASAEVDAFLAVASKTAALGLLARLALSVSYLPAEPPTESPIAAVERAVGEVQPAPPEAAIQSIPPLGDRARALAPVRDFLAMLLAALAAVTCTFGNLAAYGQTNIKRLLAYSTIAHAGYMIMPVAAALLLVDKNPAAAEAALAALALYIGVYLFMNLGAFAIVALVRNDLRSERIDDYAGLVHRAPTLAICFSILLLSLVGLPPLGGFLAKFTVFAALYDAGLLALLAIAGLNTVLSLFYYLRVVKVMTFDPEPESRLPATASLLPGTFVVAVTAPVLLCGLWGDSLSWIIQSATKNLF